jgi:hypothetical protein
MPEAEAKRVHYLNYGMTACLENGPPVEWPSGELWSSDWKDVTCLACLAGKESINTYTISDDGKSITCRRCKRTSYNPHDVHHHYCGFCHAHHDDVWPPARKAWIEELSYEMKSARSWIERVGETSFRPGEDDLETLIRCIQADALNWARREAKYSQPSVFDNKLRTIIAELLQ